MPQEPVEEDVDGTEGAADVVQRPYILRWADSKYADSPGYPTRRDEDQYLRWLDIAPGYVRLQPDALGIFVVRQSYLQLLRPTHCNERFEKTSLHTFVT